MSPDVVFFQQHPIPYFGVLSLAARLSRHGFSADVVIDSLEKDSLSVLRSLAPRMVGLSAVSTEHGWVVQRTRDIRRALPDATIIVGGIHAILYPDDILSDSSADLVCNSEGEDVLVAALRALDSAGGPDWSAVAGLSFRTPDGAVRHMPRAQLIPYDESILEDRSVYFDRYPQLMGERVLRFLSSRGCPFRCSFCYNHRIHKLFEGKGSYIRRKSVGHFIREISSQYAKYPAEFVYFYDDLFTFDRAWLTEFLKAYRAAVGLPFMCTTRADLVDDALAEGLARAGCRTVSFGVETGDAVLRRELLNKDISDEQVIRAGRCLGGHGLRVQTANMFCLPGETLAGARKTVELNIRAGTRFGFSSLFLPFPGTEIADYCSRNGYLKPDYSLRDLPPSFNTVSMLRLPDGPAITGLHRLFHWFVRFPTFFRLCGGIVRVPFLRPLFGPLFLLGNLLRYRGERGISLAAAVRTAWRIRSTF